MEGAQRTEIEDDYSFSAKLSCAALPRKRPELYIPSVSTGLEISEIENHIISDRQKILVAETLIHSGTRYKTCFNMVKTENHTPRDSQKLGQNKCLPYL